ncbi:hypothetical protein ACCS85_27660 [Rhizobium ruizarguesonis]|jgi:hypothetical protein
MQIPTVADEAGLEIVGNVRQPRRAGKRRVQEVGYGISGLIAFAGLTAGGVVAYMSDGAVAALRHWLKIN